MPNDRQYEFVYVLAPTVTNAGVEALHRELGDQIGKLGGTVENTDLWGRRKLAYAIGDFTEGIYVVQLIRGPGTMVTELERRMRVRDDVLRYLTVRVDDDLRKARRAADKRKADAERRRAARAPEAPSPPAPVPADGGAPADGGQPAAGASPAENASPAAGAPEAGGGSPGEGGPQTEVKPAEAAPPSVPASDGAAAQPSASAPDEAPAAGAAAAPHPAGEAAEASAPEPRGGGDAPPGVGAG